MPTFSDFASAANQLNRANEKLLSNTPPNVAMPNNAMPRPENLNLYDAIKKSLEESAKAAQPTTPSYGTAPEKSAQSSEEDRSIFDSYVYSADKAARAAADEARIRNRIAEGPVESAVPGSSEDPYVPVFMSQPGYKTFMDTFAGETAADQSVDAFKQAAAQVYGESSDDTASGEGSNEEREWDAIKRVLEANGYDTSKYGLLTDFQANGSRDEWRSVMNDAGIGYHYADALAKRIDDEAQRAAFLDPTQLSPEEREAIFDAAFSRLWDEQKAHSLDEFIPDVGALFESTDADGLVNYADTFSMDGGLSSLARWLAQHSEYHPATSSSYGFDVPTAYVGDNAAGMDPLSLAMNAAAGGTVGVYPTGAEDPALSNSLRNIASDYSSRDNGTANVFSNQETEDYMTDIISYLLGVYRTKSAVSPSKRSRILPRTVGLIGCLPWIPVNTTPRRRLRLWALTPSPVARSLMLVPNPLPIRIPITGTWNTMVLILLDAILTT